MTKSIEINTDSDLITDWQNADPVVKEILQASWNAFKGRLPQSIKWHSLTVLDVEFSFQQPAGQRVKEFERDVGNIRDPKTKKRLELEVGHMAFIARPQ